MISTKILMSTNQEKSKKVLIVFDDLIDDMFSNRKLNTRVAEPYIRGRKLNTFLVFIALLLYLIKLYTLIYHESSNQTRDLANFS